jgi:hypothetical protein
MVLYHLKSNMAARVHNVFSLAEILKIFSDQDEMSNFHRGSPIDAAYQVSIHLAKWFQRKRI